MEHSRSTLKCTAALAAALFANTLTAQELPSHAKWSYRPRPYTTANQTYLQLRTRFDYTVSKNQACRDFDIEKGEFQGHWRFFGGSINNAPTRYFRYFLQPGAKFGLEVSWACDDSPKVCRDFRNAIPRMLPPVPPPPPPRSSRSKPHRD